MVHPLKVRESKASNRETSATELPINTFTSIINIFEYPPSGICYIRGENAKQAILEQTVFHYQNLFPLSAKTGDMHYRPLDAQTIFSVIGGSLIKKHGINACSPRH
jgi:hypothetical protein